MAIAFLKISGGLLIFFICLRFLLKNISKAAVLTTFSGIAYLFFGDIKNTLKGFPILHHITHYRIFVPLMLILSAILFYKVIKSKKLLRSTLFLNLLFLLYIIIDLVTWFYPNNRQIGIVKTPVSPGKVQMSSYDHTTQPNIYYILLDCYPSTSYQQEVLGSYHHSLDSFLSKQGFYIVKEPRSNYSHTAFSMASIFGMNYLLNIDTAYRTAPYNYNRAMSIVKNWPLEASAIPRVLLPRANRRLRK